MILWLFQVTVILHNGWVFLSQGHPFCYNPLHTTLRRCDSKNSLLAKAEPALIIGFDHFWTYISLPFSPKIVIVVVFQFRLCFSSVILVKEVNSSVSIMVSTFSDQGVQVWLWPSGCFRGQQQEAEETCVVWACGLRNTLSCDLGATGPGANARFRCSSNQPPQLGLAAEQ